MRITGGEHRSRALKAPKGTSTRPTSDRVREALFNVLGDVCAGASVLDLYAGTGALGLEALSRGAERVVFVEQGKDALAALRANIASLGAGERARVVAGAVERAGRPVASERFDLVFADPPYADVPSGAAARAISSVLASLAESPAVLVVEHASRDAPLRFEGMRLERTRVYGDTALSSYARARATQAGDPSDDARADADAADVNG